MWYVAMLLELDSGETLKPDRNTVRSGEDRAEVLEAMAREVMREDTDVIALWEMDRKVLPLGKTVEEAAEEYVRWMYPSRLLVSSPWGEFLELHAKYMKRVSL